MMEWNISFFPISASCGPSAALWFQYTVKKLQRPPPQVRQPRCFATTSPNGHEIYPIESGWLERRKGPPNHSSMLLASYRIRRRSSVTWTTKFSSTTSRNVGYSLTRLLWAVGKLRSCSSRRANQLFSTVPDGTGILDTSVTVVDGPKLGVKLSSRAGGRFRDSCPWPVNLEAFLTARLCAVRIRAFDKHRSSGRSLLWLKRLQVIACFVNEDFQDTTKPIKLESWYIPASKANKPQRGITNMFGFFLPWDVMIYRALSGGRNS